MSIYSFCIADPGSEGPFQLLFIDSSFSIAEGNCNPCASCALVWQLIKPLKPKEILSGVVKSSFSVLTICKSNLENVGLANNLNIGIKEVPIILEFDDQLTTVRPLKDGAHILFETIKLGLKKN